MNIQDAIDTIESVAGFTDETTPAGEAWLEVLSYVNRRTAPTPHTPADGEVGELVTWLRAFANGERHEGRPATAQSLARAADLLERLASPACLVISPSPEALASLKAAGPGRIERLPLHMLKLLTVTVQGLNWPATLGDFTLVGPADNQGAWRWYERQRNGTTEIVKVDHQLQPLGRTTPPPRHPLPPLQRPTPPPGQ